MQLQDFLLCDDIRTESGNKISIMGIYDSGIALTGKNPEPVRFPAAMPLAFYLRLKLDTNDPTIDGFNLDFSYNGTRIANASGSMSIGDRSKSFSIYAKLPNFPLLGLGRIEFRLTLKEGPTVVQEIVPDYLFEVSVEQVKS